MIPDWLLANHAPRKYEFRKVAERDRPLVETLLRARAKELLAQVDGDLMDRFKKETSIDRLGKS